MDRIKGGSGPGGLKAVAPTGAERIVFVVDAEENGVSILGDKLAVTRVDGTDNFTASGRPIAVISNVMLEYVPRRLRSRAGQTPVNGRPELFRSSFPSSTKPAPCRAVIDRLLTIDLPVSARDPDRRRWLDGRHA